MHTKYYGRQLDNFFRANGTKIRDVAMMVVSLLAPETPLWPVPWASLVRAPLHTASSATVLTRPANIGHNNCL